jgi:hypothetical protein
MLTDERIAKTLGFSEYTTESTKATLTSIARAVEAEATAPLLARIAELERKIEDAFREGYWARSTYNDMEVSDEDEEWAKFAKSNGIKE